MLCSGAMNGTEQVEQVGTVLACLAKYRIEAIKCRALNYNVPK